MCSHTELQGNTNTVDKVTAILDGSTHSEFKSFGETIQMIFCENKTQHFTAFIIMRGKFMCCGLLSAVRSENREQSYQFMWAYLKHQMGPLIKKKSVHLSSKQPCNPTSIIKIITTDIKTVIYTCEYLSRITKLSHLDIKYTTTYNALETWMWPDTIS